MTRDVIPGAWYGDALPTGEFVATVKGSHMATHLGRIDFPPGETFGLVTPRCTNVGGFRFAGQAHDLVGVTWEYEGRWRDRGPTNGVNGAIYDRDGVLHRAGPETSQGYRYVAPDGALVTGDATYGPRHGLNEYTDLSAAQDGSLLIGQGNPDAGAPEGVMVWDGAVGLVRVLEAGSRKFINAHVLGETVSLAFYSEQDAGVVRRLGTLAELRALPPAGRVPGPIVNTEQEKESLTMTAKPLPADVHAIAVALHARHLPLAQGSDDDRRALQKKICETVCARKGPAWGWKSNHGVGVANAKDAIAQLPDGAAMTLGLRQPLYMWDLFNGGTRAPNPLPVMSETEHVDQFFVPVEPIDHLAGVVVQPDPVKPPPGDKPVDLSPVMAQLKALTEALGHLSGEIDALKVRPVVDQAAVGKAVSTMLEAMLPGYEVAGDTSVMGSGRLRHSHGVKLAITRKA